jgi:CBS domain containing-hemolysin-like protein
MIHAVIELGDQRVHEVMVPRIAMVTLAASATFEDAIETVVAEGHSRIPVYDDSVDEIVGILYAKDLLPFLKGTVEQRPSLRSILRTPVFVPESMTVDGLLHELQRRKVHLAIVLDEYGGTAGLVTIEDLLEEIVGEIRDEYDEESEPVTDEGDGVYVFSGKVDIDALGDHLGVEIAREGFETVGGFLLARLGRVPAVGEKLDVDDLAIEVLEAERRRVNKVRIRKRETVPDRSEG